MRGATDGERNAKDGTVVCRIHIALILGLLALGAAGGAGDAALAQETFRDLICSYSWPCEKAMAVAMCESTMNPRAYSAGQYGLFQVAYRYHAERVSAPEDLYDPAINTRIAWEIWSASGWDPWPGCGQR